MNKTLMDRFRKLVENDLPLLGKESYATRLQQLFEVGREDLSLAKLAEAHWDAVAILAENNRKKQENALYAVWASEIPGKQLELKLHKKKYILSGTKMFCTGAKIVDRALLTADGFLIDLDLRSHEASQIQISDMHWTTNAFKETQTSTIKFKNVIIVEQAIIGTKGWYVNRPGFWPGSLGPAACWGGGAAGLRDYALDSSRNDTHTLAHLAAMDANIWAIKSMLSCAGNQIDENKTNFDFAKTLGYKVRHLIEQLCTDTLRRFARAYGPFPLACDANISRRYQELDLFLRQNHGERDLEVLGSLLKTSPST